MENLDVDKILSVMNSPTTGENAKNLFEMLDKADQVLKKFELIVQRLDRMGLKPLIVRGLGVQLGIDPETPLKCESGSNTAYVSPTHQVYIDEINKFSELDLKTQIEAAKAGLGSKKNESVSKILENSG